MTLLLHIDPDTAPPLLSALGPDAHQVTSLPELRSALQAEPTTELVVVGPDVELSLALEIASSERVEQPHLGVVLVRTRVDSGVLTQALRAGVRDVVKADNLAALGDACERSRELTRQVTGVAATTQRARGLLSTVFSAKGGCGKTTTATNLAAALADGGRRAVVLVDLDLGFGDVAIAMQLRPQRTLGDISHLDVALDPAVVESLVTHHSPGLDVVAAPVEPSSTEVMPVHTVAALLDTLTTMYDHVVVDTPPAFTDHVLAAFDRSDHFVLLATLDVPALKNLKITLETMGMLGYSRDAFHVVLNRSDAKVGLSADDVEKTLGHHIAVQVPSSRAVPASVNRGVVLTLDQPGHPVSTAVQRFARTLEGLAAARAPVRERRSLRLRRHQGVHS